MTNGSDLPIPEDGEPCLGLGREEQVYDYYNGVLVGDRAREFEAHLMDCFTCRQKMATLDWINGTLKAELMPASEEAIPDNEREDASSKQQHVSPENLENSVPAFYIILGGLSLVGVLGLGILKLVEHFRQRRSLAAVGGETAG